MGVGENRAGVSCQAACSRATLPASPCPTLGPPLPRCGVLAAQRGAFRRGMGVRPQPRSRGPPGRFCRPRPPGGAREPTADMRGRPAPAPGPRPRLRTPAPFVQSLAFGHHTERHFPV